MVEEGVDTVNPKVAGLASFMALAFVIGPALAYAQWDAQQEELVVHVPFRFVAAGQAHDAGAYELLVSQHPGSIEIVPSRGPDEVIPVATRLAAPPEPPTSEGRLVFDKVGDSYTLSEVWVSDEDGFLVHSTKETHTHQTVPLRRKPR
jgi:hypothetical protein